MSENFSGLVHTYTSLWEFTITFLEGFFPQQMYCQCGSRKYRKGGFIPKVHVFISEDQSRKSAYELEIFTVKIHFLYFLKAWVYLSNLRKFKQLFGIKIAWSKINVDRFHVHFITTYLGGSKICPVFLKNFSQKHTKFLFTRLMPIPCILLREILTRWNKQHWYGPI